MLEKILKLYVMSMAGDVRSPLPHLFGPPGCGKSTAVEQAADLLGVNLHIINVSRISPLEIEGVQMPTEHATEGMYLKLLTATFWTQLKEGDILLLDEFLRAFPEVYNGLLDILTSRQVGGYKLPKVFIIAASNTTVSYDKALEDRLLHLDAPDPRRNRTVKTQMAQSLVDALGLHPDMVHRPEMNDLLDQEVLPMYEILDKRGKNSGGSSSSGSSLRKLIGQAQLREVQSTALGELINMNNLHCMQKDHPQYVLLFGSHVKAKFVEDYVKEVVELLKGSRLTDKQRQNIELNLQLVEMERANPPVSYNPNTEGTDPHEDIFA